MQLLTGNKDIMKRKTRLKYTCFKNGPGVEQTWWNLCLSTDAQQVFNFTSLAGVSIVSEAGDLALRCSHHHLHCPRQAAAFYSLEAQCGGGMGQQGEAHLDTGSMEISLETCIRIEERECQACQEFLLGILSAECVKQSVVDKGN
uniref:Uncharacterized protein n=1 Tax=Branchiostoma floridae TaxID=7739 RepID=C3YLC4_BRAFL|eukprot:XP_002602849.1 hypothetical protein BRAFLDRAFT_128943 [Branchiostoma floridae]